MFYCTSILVMYWKLIGNDISTCQYKFETDTFNVWHIVELQASKYASFTRERERQNKFLFLCGINAIIFYLNMIQNLFCKRLLISDTDVSKFEDLTLPWKMKHFWNNFDCAWIVPRLQIEDDMKNSRHFWYTVDMKWMSVSVRWV
jgi:hypothetical protein